MVLVGIMNPNTIWFKWKKIIRDGGDNCPINLSTPLALLTYWHKCLYTLLLETLQKYSCSTHHLFLQFCFKAQKFAQKIVRKAAHVDYIDYISNEIMGESARVRAPQITFVLVVVLSCFCLVLFFVSSRGNIGLSLKRWRWWLSVRARACPESSTSGRLIGSSTLLMEPLHTNYNTKHITSC